MHPVVIITSTCTYISIRSTYILHVPYYIALLGTRIFVLGTHIYFFNLHVILIGITCMHTCYHVNCVPEGSDLKLALGDLHVITQTAITQVSSSSIHS